MLLNWTTIFSAESHYGENIEEIVLLNLYHSNLPAGNWSRIPELTPVVAY